jgi:hypothetical protein
MTANKIIILKNAASSIKDPETKRSTNEIIKVLEEILLRLDKLESK